MSGILVPAVFLVSPVVAYLIRKIWGDRTLQAAWKFFFGLFYVSALTIFMTAMFVSLVSGRFAQFFVNLLLTSLVATTAVITRSVVRVGMGGAE